MKAPVIDEPLSRKWADMLELPETRDRVMVQNYETGRIKLVRPNQVDMVTTGTIITDQKVKIEAPPVWRVVDNGEKKELWKAEVYFQYCRHMAISSRQRWAIYENDVQKFGGSVVDVNMIEDSRKRSNAIKANNAADKRDREAEKAKKYAEYGGFVNVERNGKHFVDTESKLSKFLRDSVKKHREQRDIDEIQKKESVILKQEEMREKARQQVRKDIHAKVGSAEE